jgi:hypothetical protein
MSTSVNGVRAEVFLNVQRFHPSATAILTVQRMISRTVAAFGSNQGTIGALSGQKATGSVAVKNE